MLTGNKGEWSEVYTLFKILTDRNLHTGDTDLNQIEGGLLPIINILRDQSNGTFNYEYDKDIVVIKGTEEEFRIPISSFQKQAKLLLEKLQSKTKGAFSIPEIESFLNSFNCSSLKAKSTIKSDIRVIVYDDKTGSNPELGFSIKSQLGGAATLLNAGKTTNFIYKIPKKLSQTEVDTINAIEGRSKIKDRLDIISSDDFNLIFTETENKKFGNNLTLIDSALSLIVSQLILEFYSSSISKVSELTERVSELNPSSYDVSDEQPFYTYKIKRFLTDTALGMTPSKTWSGQLDATGGYLVVKEDGEILCYHIYNRNEFEDYLFSNTKLETASSSRHEFGKVYKENQEFYFKLNLQIRFIK